MRATPVRDFDTKSTTDRCKCFIPPGFLLKRDDIILCFARCVENVQINRLWRCILHTLLYTTSAMVAIQTKVYFGHVSVLAATAKDPEYISNTVTV
jgi:hypothetical protein